MEDWPSWRSCSFGSLPGGSQSSSLELVQEILHCCLYLLRKLVHHLVLEVAAGTIMAS